MNETEQALYDRICQFSFDEGDEELAFASRLARENGWTREYTARVVHEYKRFVFLAVAAGHPVTPSDQVDQVWHLHLMYTRSYWDGFCGQVLGTPLHHGPTRGGVEELRKFTTWYAMTLQSYKRFFGHEPPADIWPETSIRFGDNLRFQRINTKLNWVVAKRQLIETAGKIIGLVALTIVLFTLYLSLNVSPGIFKVSFVSQMSIVRADVESSGSDGEHVNISEVLFFLGVFVAITIGYSLLIEGKCPECRRRKALKPSGSERYKGVPAIFGKRATYVTEYELQCKYCGHCEWRQEGSDGCACA